MKLLFITDHLAPYPGGISVYCESIIPRLKNAGIDVTIFGPRGSKTADHALPTFSVVPKFTKNNHLFCFPSLKLMRAIASNKYDLIHINSPLALFSIPVYIMAKIKKIKVICANHGNMALYCNYNSKNWLMAKLSTFLGGTITYLPQILFRPTILQNPGCSDLQKLYKNQLKSLTIKDMICGIDLNYFEYSATFKMHTLISIGRLSPEKNWLRLLDLFALLPKYYRLEIIGSGGQEKELKTYCRTHKLDNVHFIGEIPHNQVGEYLKNAQAYISASLFETWGLTLTESLACGTPIVYPNCEPFKYLYGKEFPEGSYEINDEQAFVKAVMETEKTTPECRTSCSSFAKQFSWDHATSHLINIYESQMTKPVKALA
jgi:glycosyltransferase involved in cell wall biosynthesis